MLKHPVLLAGLGLAMALPAARSAPVTTRYRVESKNETTVDLSSLGQPVQQSSFGLVSWIAVTLSDTTGGRIVHVLVDSMKYEGTIPLLTQLTADSAWGGILHGWVDQGGRVKDLVAQPQNLLLADVQGVIHGFFPKMKGGAKAGEGWSDTIEVSNTTNGANVKSKFLIDYTAGGTETISGMPALSVSATSSAILSGTMENPQAGTMEVSGNVKGNSQSLLGLDGRYFGGHSSSTTDQLLKITMAPIPIPVRTVRTVTVTWIP
jgi:hypothetical protein